MIKGQEFEERRRYVFLTLPNPVTADMGLEVV
jgi:hypothetical protein